MDLAQDLIWLHFSRMMQSSEDLTGAASKMAHSHGFWPRALFPIMWTSLLEFLEDPHIMTVSFPQK